MRRYTESVNMLEWEALEWMNGLTYYHLGPERQSMQIALFPDSLHSVQ